MNIDLLRDFLTRRKLYSNFLNCNTHIHIVSCFITQISSLASSITVLLSDLVRLRSHNFYLFQLDVTLTLYYEDASASVLMSCADTNAVYFGSIDTVTVAPIPDLRTFATGCIFEPVWASTGAITAEYLCPAGQLLQAEGLCCKYWAEYKYYRFLKFEMCV